MLQSIWDDIRREFDYGNMVKKIVIVNVIVYLVINILWVIFRISGGFANDLPLYEGLLRLLSVSDDWWHMLTRPWTLLTHMFTHQHFFHILWNMLFLFWFGRIFGDLYGDQRVLPLYLTGGLAGFVLFFTVMNLTSLGGSVDIAYGASGAVACILTAIGMLSPEYGIRLMFIGTVRLKYIVLFMIFAQIISLGTLDNIGGTIDHLGGIVFGILFALNLQRGRDLTEPAQRAIAWVSNGWDRLMTPSKDHKSGGPRVSYRSGKSVKETAPKTRPSFMRKAEGSSSSGSKSSSRGGGRSSTLDDKASHQEQLDAILDKIKDRGYNSLSKDEKDFLFRASNQ